MQTARPLQTVAYLQARKLRNASPTRRTWQIAFSGWRQARRDLLADGAIEQADFALRIMRELSNDWQLPTIGAQQQEASRVLPPVVMANGREFPRKVWCGPYLTGRRFLRRTAPGALR